MIWIEAAAVLFGLLAVYFTIGQKIWCWPAGLIQVSLYIIIFYQVKLYSDLILHVIYVGIQIWLHGGENRTELKVSRLSRKAVAGWILAIAVGTAAWGTVMGSLTDAAVPYGDAFTTTASLVAIFLQARKRIETWLFWIAVDDEHGDAVGTVNDAPATVVRSHRIGR